MVTWFEIGLGAVNGRCVVECTEVETGKRPRLLCLFPADDASEVREAARWAMGHEARWHGSHEPVVSVAQVVNTFAPLRT